MRVSLKAGRKASPLSPGQWRERPNHGATSRKSGQRKGERTTNKEAPFSLSLTFENMHKRDMAVGTLLAVGKSREAGPSSEVAGPSDSDRPHRHSRQEEKKVDRLKSTHSIHSILANDKKKHVYNL